MKKARARTQPTPPPELQADFEKALYSRTERAQYPVPAVLQALDQLLIKPKRVAAALHVTVQQAHRMMTGQAATVAKHVPALYHLLRLAVVAARRTLDQADRGAIRWRDGLAYPTDAIAFMRERTAAAQKVLDAEEKQ